MEQESVLALYLRQALASGLACTALHQLRYYRLSYLFPVLPDIIDQAFIFFLNVTTVCFALCVAKPSISDPSAITNLSTLRCTLAGFILSLTIFGDSPLKRVLAGFAISAGWMLGWTITSVEERAPYQKFLKNGLYLLPIDDVFKSGFSPRSCVILVLYWLSARLLEMFFGQMSGSIDSAVALGNAL